MRVTAGERAVHIIVSYDQAVVLAALLLIAKSDPDMDELYGKLAPSVSAGMEKGYPRPPLPRHNVAHNSEVTIVE